MSFGGKFSLSASIVTIRIVLRLITPLPVRSARSCPVQPILKRYRQDQMIAMLSFTIYIGGCRKVRGSCHLEPSHRQIRNSTAPHLAMLSNQDTSCLSAVSAATWRGRSLRECSMSTMTTSSGRSRYTRKCSPALTNLRSSAASTRTAQLRLCALAVQDRAATAEQLSLVKLGLPVPKILNRPSGNLDKAGFRTARQP